MARGRMIAATVADDKRFNELPIDAALVYLMAIPQLDRDGLILGEPGALWGQACRRRNDLLPRMDAIISAWLASGLVTAYKNEDGDTILHFVGFQKNQAMTHYDREAASRFPCPPGYFRTPKGLVLEQTQQAADQVRTYSGHTPDEVSPNAIQSKVSRSECNGDAPATAAADSAAFISAYKHTWALVPASEYEAAKVKDWSERVTLECWQYALEECVNHRQTGQWKYLETILRRVEREGLPQGAAVAAAPTANGKVTGFSLAELTGGA